MYRFVTPRFLSIFDKAVGPSNRFEDRTSHRKGLVRRLLEATMFFLSEIRPAPIVSLAAFVVLSGTHRLSSMPSWLEQPFPAYGRRPSARLKFAHIAEQVS